MLSPLKTLVIRIDESNDFIIEVHFNSHNPNFHKIRMNTNKLSSNCMVLHCSFQGFSYGSILVLPTIQTSVYGKFKDEAGDRHTKNKFEDFQWNIHILFVARESSKVISRPQEQERLKYVKNITILESTSKHLIDKIHILLRMRLCITYLIKVKMWLSVKLRFQTKHYLFRNN